MSATAKTMMTYPDVVDAYNYCVGYFINPLDCSRRVESGVVLPFNKNDFLELFFNKIKVVCDVRRDEGRDKLTFVYRSPRDGEEGFLYRPRFVGKWWYNQHVVGTQTLYYRSKHNCCARIGFHSYEAAHTELPWAEDFGITGKCVRFPHIGWMLLGFDLDAKGGEADVHELLDWLLVLFPAAYHEPSTGGKGVHLYVKLAYRVDHAGSLYETLIHIDDRVCRLSRQLSRRTSGFRSKLDGIRSLPTVLAFDSGKRRCVVRKRYNCIKAPRCPRGLDDLHRFHMAPFFLYDHLELVVAKMEQEEVADQREPSGPDLQYLPPVPDDDDDDCVVEVSSAGGFGTGADTPEQVVAASLDPDGEEEAPFPPPPSPLDHYKNCTPNGDSNGSLKALRSEANGLKRKLGFVMWESRRVRTMRPVVHYLDRYEELGLARRPERDRKRVDDMTAVVSFVAKKFDPTVGFSLDGYESEREQIELLIADRLKQHPDVPLTWQKEAHRTRRLDPKYLTATLFALRRAARDGHAHATEQQLIDQCRALIDRTPHRNMMGQITLVLRRIGLVQKVSDPVFGAGRFNRGTGWRVNP